MSDELLIKGLMLMSLRELWGCVELYANSLPLLEGADKLQKLQSILRPMTEMKSVDEMLKNAIATWLIAEGAA